MKIAVFEPFYGGSHKKWADGLQKHLEAEVKLFTLSASHWKWRMHASAITLCKQYQESGFKADLIIASDMMDLALFRAYAGDLLKEVPIALYFHENQFAYPWNDNSSEKDVHYPFMNYSSALVADRVFFNSEYNRNSFFSGLRETLKLFPDNKNLWSISEIEKKSQVLHLGIDLLAFDQFKAAPKTKLPRVLWNHRWEHDKNPEEFFQCLFELQKEGLEFELIVLGESYTNYPAVFDEAKHKLSNVILHFGYATTFSEYATLLKSVDIIPVTSNQDFFGISVIEAVYCGATPLLPKRLAFKELFENENCFYEEGQLFNSLRNAMTQPRHSGSTISKNMLRFDWTKMKRTYNKSFQKIVERA